jgi:hypothetical protein
MEIDRLKRGVGTVTIPQRLLRQILVPVPPESFQQDIETRYREMVTLQRQGYMAEARRRFEYMKNNIEAMVNA